MKRTLLSIVAVAVLAGCSTTARYHVFNPQTGQVTDVTIKRPPFTNTRYAKITITPDGKLTVGGAESSGDVESQKTFWGGLQGTLGEVAERAARGARP